MHNILIYTDGGSRGNPGPAAYGFVVRKGDALLHQEGKVIGIDTNNTAEYMGILESLQWIRDNRQLIGEISGIDMRMDSLLACQQLKGIFRIKKAHLVVLHARIQATIRELGVRVTFTHVPREQNKAADAMVNAALDNDKENSLE